MDTLSAATNESLNAMVAEATGLPRAMISIAVRPPLDYQSNQLYDVWADRRHLIIKEFLKPDEFAHAPVREYRALELLSALDIAPQPVFFQPNPDPPLGPIVIYEYLEGEMWVRRCPSANELAQLAEVWLMVNALPTDNLWMSRGQDRSLDDVWAGFLTRFQRYAAWTETAYAAGRQAADLCLGLLERHRVVVRELTDSDPPLCFCRSDPRFANVIQRPDGRLGLVDWEDSGLGDPARDLADIMTHANQEDLVSPDEWQAFLQPYLAVRMGLDPGLRRRMHLYRAVFPVFWLNLLLGQGLGMIESGQPVTWHVHGLPAVERLRRYLARGLAWPALEFSNQMEALAGIEFFPADTEPTPKRSRGTPI